MYSWRHLAAIQTPRAGSNPDHMKPGIKPKVSPLAKKQDAKVKHPPLQLTLVHRFHVRLRALHHHSRAAARMAAARPTASSGCGRQGPDHLEQHPGRTATSHWRSVKGGQARLHTCVPNSTTCSCAVVNPQVSHTPHVHCNVTPAAPALHRPLHTFHMQAAQLSCKKADHPMDSTCTQYNITCNHPAALTPPEPCLHPRP